ncbi:integrator complex subunit 15 isoform X2 [Anabrus simplex]|uniref:integrator complex subunit 15 isoform X2 n=1 Tax=Anabrus simplex TaxID=316456 RepID=UPI0034DCD8CC
MAISALDLKQSLRKLEFPFSAREALSRVEQICVHQGGGRLPGLASEIISEFIFCETDRRGGRKRARLTYIHELQLLEVLCDYFAYTGGGNDAIRNIVFMALFPPGHVSRSRLLAKLVSMAISTKNTPVLTATGIWMQQLGCTSQVCLDLAQGLVKDYFVLVPKAVSGLQDLPQLAPQFTANILTAVAEMFGCDDKKQILNSPPDALLEVITQWVADNPNLCLAALLVNQPATPVTPFVGLFKWCILAPLQNGRRPDPQLYSRLHLGLLESLLECSTIRVPALRENVIATQHFTTLVKVVARMCKGSGSSDEVQLSLDRLAQAIEVALAVQCTQGNTEELMNQLEKLPENRLMTILIDKHKNVIVLN